MAGRMTKIYQVLMRTIFYATKSKIIILHYDAIHFISILSLLHIIALFEESSTQARSSLYSSCSGQRFHHHIWSIPEQEAGTAPQPHTHSIYLTIIANQVASTLPFFINPFLKQMIFIIFVTENNIYPCMK